MASDGLEGYVRLRNGYGTDCPFAVLDYINQVRVHGPRALLYSL